MWLIGKMSRMLGPRIESHGWGLEPLSHQIWANRFCELTDTGLRDRVLEIFSDPITRHLPWHEDGGVLNMQNRAFVF